MGFKKRLAASAAVAALFTGLGGAAWASTPAELATALSALMKSKTAGAEVVLGAPTEEDGTVRFHNVVFKEPGTPDVKIDTLSFAGAQVVDGGKSVTADAMVAELITGGDDQAKFSVDSIELDNPVFAEDNAKAKVDSVSLTNAKIEPAGKSPITIASAGFDLGEFANDIPHTIGISVEGVSFAPADFDEAGATAGQLKAMGYDKVELSFYGSGNVDKATGDLSLEEITIDGTDIGSVTLSGEFGGVTDEVLKKLGKANPSPELIGKVTLKSASLYYGDASLAGRLIAMQAKAAGQEPGAFVDQITGALPLMLSVVGNPSFQDKLAKGVTTFLKDPKNLEITVAPDKPLGLIELFGAAQMAPQTLPDVLKADVLANQAEDEDDSDVDNGDDSGNDSGDAPADDSGDVAPAPVK